MGIPQHQIEKWASAAQSQYGRMAVSMNRLFIKETGAEPDCTSCIGHDLASVSRARYYRGR